MKISKISIKNFRSIKDEVVFENFGNALILIGKNNSGKSAILNCIIKCFTQEKFADSDFHKGTSEIELKVCFECIDKQFILDNIVKIQDKFTATEKQKIEGISCLDDYNTADEPIRDGIDRIVDPLLSHLDSGIIEFIFSTQKGQSLTVKFIDGSDAKKWLGLFPNCVLIDDERKFSDEQGIKAGSLTEALIKSISLHKEEKLETHVLSKLASDLTYGEIEKLLESKFQEETTNIQVLISDKFETFYKPGYLVKLNPNLNTTYKTYSLAPKIYDPILEEEIELDKVGAGLRSIYILSLLKTLVEQGSNYPTIFFIEEPELYLHPGLQKEFAQTLKRISEENLIIFTTHASLTLSPFSSQSIYEVSNTSGVTTTSLGEISSILSNLGFSTTDILGKDVVIFVEGVSDLNILEQLVIKRFHSKKDKIAIVDCNSCEGLPIFATMKFLSLTSIATSNNRLLLRDRDYHVFDTETEIQTKTELAFISNHTPFDSSKLKILDKSSIENYFLDFTVISLIDPTKTQHGYIDYLKIFIGIEPGNASLLKKQVIINNAQAIIDGLTSANYESEIKKLRGHNVFDALMCYLNEKNSDDEIKIFIHSLEKKIFEKQFITNYVAQSTNQFDEIKGYLEEIPFLQP